MAFDIGSFISNMDNHDATSHADKFDVMFNIPVGLQNSGLLAAGINMNDLTLQCEVSELPGRDIAMVEYRKYAFIERIPHHNQYGQASFTFIVTGDMWEKIFIDTWMDFMIPAQNGLVNYAIDGSMNRNYETDITCNQYDLTGNVAYSVLLIDAAPISCSALGQDWNNDSIHRLNVSFQFRKWTSIATTYNQTMPGIGAPTPIMTPSGTLSTGGTTTTTNPSTITT
jgi:hypothetical protein